jgi:hypothetical protein
MSASRLLFVTVTLLFFLGFSTQTQGQDTPTPESPTLVPTETPIPPSDTPLPSSETPLPPSDTPVPPTNTDTPLPPTNTVTPFPPTETATPESTEALPTLPTLPTATTENTPDIILPSSTPLASVMPVQPVTITPELAPAVNWSVVFSDSFETPNLMAWLFTDLGWGYTTQPDGTTALRVFNTAAPVYYQPSDYANVAVEVSVNVAAGNAHVYARQSAAGVYEAQLTTSGDVLLSRSGIVLAAAQLPDFSALQPHRVRLNVYENYVAVEVDGQTQLSVVDPTPLPPGRIGFAASFPALAEGVVPVPPQNTVVFDNVVVYQPAGQIVPTVAPPSPTPLMLPSATPAYPPIQLPPLPEAARFSTFALDEGINIPNGDVAALIAAMSMGGSSTIHLAENGEYVLTEASADLFAPTGLPIIASGSELTIYGHHAVIRAANSGFRLFGVDQGTLSLSDLTIRDATLFTNGGAAVSNNGGIVTLTNVRMENNRVEVDTTYGRGTAFRGRFLIEWHIQGRVQVATPASARDGKGGVHG